MAQVEILKNAAFNTAEVIARSLVSDVPQAATIMCGYLAQSHERFVAYYEGDIACIMGLIAPTLLSDRAYLWALNTELVEKHKFLFIRHSRLWIEGVLEAYTELHGHTDIAKPQSIRWLKWLGAEFDVEPNQGLLPFRIHRRG